MSYFSFVKKWNKEHKLPWMDAINQARKDYYDDKKAQTILTVKLPKKITGILRKSQKKEKEQFKQSKTRMLTLLDPKSSKKIVLKAAPYFSKKETKKAVKDIFGEDLYKGKDSPSSSAHRPLGIEKSSKKRKPFPSSKRVTFKKRKPLGIEKSSKKKKDLAKNSKVKLSTTGEKKSSLLSLYRKRKPPLAKTDKLLTRGEEKKIQDLDDEEIEIYRDAYSKYFRPNPNENMKQRAVSLLKKIGEKKKESAYELEGAIVRYDIQLKKAPDLQDVVIAIVNKEAELGLIIPEF